MDERAGSILIQPSKSRFAITNHTELVTDRSGIEQAGHEAL